MLIRENEDIDNEMNVESLYMIVYKNHVQLSEFFNTLNYTFHIPLHLFFPYNNSTTI